MWIRPAKLAGYAAALRKELDRYSLTGLAVGGTDRLSLSDFSGDTPVELWRTQELAEEALDILRGQGGLLLTNPNDSFFTYAERIADVPTSTDKLQLLDEAIPFYQLALSGLIPLTSAPINQSPSPDMALLEALATGTAPQFLVGADLYGAELVGTPLEYAVGAAYARGRETIAQALQTYRTVTDAVGSRLVGYRNLAPGVMQADYEHGSIVVNTGSAAYSDGALTVEGGQFRILEGGAAA